MTIPPAVSIGLLTYNYERYIRTAIDSVLAQTFTNWELLVSDDCSTDNTAAVVAPYLVDPRIRYVRHVDNLRQGGNWAYAIRHGMADRVATLHADDWWTPDALATAMRAFDAEPNLDLLSGWYERVDANGWPTPSVYQSLSPGDGRMAVGGEAAYVAEVLAFSCVPSLTMFRRRVLGDAGLPRTDLDMLVDYDFFLRVAAVSRGVMRLPQTLAMYRNHASGATAVTTADGRLVDELRRMSAIAQASHPVGRRSHQALRLRMARELYNCGLGRFIAGHQMSGFELIREAARHDGAILWSPMYLADLLLTFGGSVTVPIIERLHVGRRAH